MNKDTLVQGIIHRHLNQKMTRGPKRVQKDPKGDRKGPKGTKRNQKEPNFTILNLWNPICLDFPSDKIYCIDYQFFLAKTKT